MPNRNSSGQNFIKPTKKDEKGFFEEKYFFEDEIKRVFFVWSRRKSV